MAVLQMCTSLSFLKEKADANSLLNRIESTYTLSNSSIQEIRNMISGSKVISFSLNIVTVKNHIYLLEKSITFREMSRHVVCSRRLHKKNVDNNIWHVFQLTIEKGE
jgi:hypothetical protein